MIDPKALTQSILRMAATDNAGGIELLIVGLIEGVQAAERRECAKVAAYEAEEHRLRDDHQRMDAARWIASKIRDRSER